MLVPKKIANIGIQEALRLLMPVLRDAGQFAKTIQPQIAHEFLVSPEQAQEKGGSRFASALTMGDLLVEDIVGARIRRLFSDVSFHGEEHANDRISHFFPLDQEFILTLDPINGTRYYRDGRPLFECILNICEARSWRILGSAVYDPPSDIGYMGFISRSGVPIMLRIHWEFSEMILERYHLNQGLVSPANKTIYLEKGFGKDAENKIRDLGYTPIYPYSGYTGQTEWNHRFFDVLTGRCVGCARRDAHLIDHSAVAFLAQCAGGFWRSGEFNPETLRFDYNLIAATPEVDQLLRTLL